MTEVVEFRQNTPTTEEGGGDADNYTTLLTTRGQLISNSGGRGLSFGAIQDSFSFTLRVRFQSALEAALRSDTKILISGSLYTFSTYKLIDQKKHLYEFQVTKVSN